MIFGYQFHFSTIIWIEINRGVSFFFLTYWIFEKQLCLWCRYLLQERIMWSTVSGTWQRLQRLESVRRKRKWILLVINILQRKREQSTSFLLLWTHVCEVLIEGRFLWEVLYLLLWYWRSVIELISFLFWEMMSSGEIQSTKVSISETFNRRSAFSFRGTPWWLGSQTIFMLGTRSTVRWSLLKSQIMTFGEENERWTKAVITEKLSVRISRGIECDTSPLKGHWL